MYPLVGLLLEMDRFLLSIHQLVCTCRLMDPVWLLIWTPESLLCMMDVV